jgi:hypothetical protein
LIESFGTFSLRCEKYLGDNKRESNTARLPEELGFRF